MRLGNSDIAVSELALGTQRWGCSLQQFFEELCHRAVGALRGRHQPDRHGGAVSHRGIVVAEGADRSGCGGGARKVLVSLNNSVLASKISPLVWSPSSSIDDRGRRCNPKIEKIIRLLLPSVEELRGGQHWGRRRRSRRRHAIDAIPRRSIARVRLGPGSHHGAERGVIPGSRGCHGRADQRGKARDVQTGYGACNDNAVGLMGARQRNRSAHGMYGARASSACPGRSACRTTTRS